MIGVFSRTTLDDQPTPPALATWLRTFDRLDHRDTLVGLQHLATRRPELSPVEPPLALVADDKAESATAEFAVRSEPLAITVSFVDAGEHARIQAALGLPDLSDATLASLVAQLDAPRPDPAELAAATARLQAQQVLVETLENRLDDIKADTRAALKMADEKTYDAQLDAAVYAEELERVERRNRAMARLLADNDIHEAWSAGTDADGDSNPETPARPRSWQELADTLSEWETRGVTFTADVETMLGLDDIDDDRRALENSWRGLRALAGYVRAKNGEVFVGGFGAYLDAQPPGFPTFPPQWYAPTEGADTMAVKEWARQRDFPVPDAIDSSGRVAMGAHLRLAKIPNKNPRLYFFDDTSGKTGAVVVGYIGPHLTNRQTAKLN